MASNLTYDFVRYSYIHIHISFKYPLKSLTSHPVRLLSSRGPTSSACLATPRASTLLGPRTCWFQLDFPTAKLFFTKGYLQVNIPYVAWPYVTCTNLNTNATWSFAAVAGKLRSFDSVRKFKKCKEYQPQILRHPLGCSTVLKLRVGGYRFSSRLTWFWGHPLIINQGPWICNSAQVEVPGSTSPPCWINWRYLLMAPWFLQKSSIFYQLRLIYIQFIQICSIKITSQDFPLCMRSRCSMVTRSFAQS